jgi:hypothetical protein
MWSQGEREICAEQESRIINSVILLRKSLLLSFDKMRDGLVSDNPVLSVVIRLLFDLPVAKDTFTQLVLAISNEADVH